MPHTYMAKLTQGLDNRPYVVIDDGWQQGRYGQDDQFDEIYNGGPWMRYSEGWYYVISVTELPCQHYTNYIFRTKDFKDWYVGYYNPILMPDEDDRKISPRAADFTEEMIEKIKTNGFNINNSDIDMCDYNGKVYINYACGNQLGYYYMAEAEYDGTVANFLKSYFE